MIHHPHDIFIIFILLTNNKQIKFWNETWNYENRDWEGTHVGAYFQWVFNVGAVLANSILTKWGASRHHKRQWTKPKPKNFLRHYRLVKHLDRRWLRPKNSSRKQEHIAIRFGFESMIYGLKLDLNLCFLFEFSFMGLSRFDICFCVNYFFL